MSDFLLPLLTCRVIFSFTKNKQFGHFVVVVYICLHVFRNWMDAIQREVISKHVCTAQDRRHCVGWCKWGDGARVARHVHTDLHVTSDYAYRACFPPGRMESKKHHCSSWDANALRNIWEIAQKRPPCISKGQKSSVCLLELPSTIWYTNTWSCSFRWTFGSDFELVL